MVFHDVKKSKEPVKTIWCIDENSCKKETNKQKQNRRAKYHGSQKKIDFSRRHGRKLPLQFSKPVFLLSGATARVHFPAPSYS